MKLLLNDNGNSDVMFIERSVSTIENESFVSVVIGSCFIGMLSTKGEVFVLEYQDKLIKLYNKYFISSIAVARDYIYGLSKGKDNLNLKRSESSFITVNHITSLSTSDVNYYLHQWNYKHINNENEWYTTLYKVLPNIKINSLSLLDSNGNGSVLL